MPKSKRIKNKFLHDIKPFVDKTYGSYRYNLIMHNAFRRYSALVRENGNESRLLKKHTRERIYPAIAMFYSLLHNNIPRDEAYDFLENYYAWRSEKAAHSIRKLLRIPGLYVLAPRMFRRMTQRQFGASAGFECDYVSVRRDNVEFDILSCPYFDICSKYGCPELTRIFCLADDICYSEMHPKLEFRRFKTLGRGDECCDFKITIR